MSIVDSLTDAAQWQAFYEYKAADAFADEGLLSELEAFIAERRFLLFPISDSTLGFALPQRLLVNKANSTAKRVVYTFSADEMTVLRFIAWQLHRYNGFFAPNCYAFRRGYSAKRAFTRLSSACGGEEYCGYKLDIKDYFGSIDVPLLLPILREYLAEEPQLYVFFESLLTQDAAIIGGQLTPCRRGAMAGLPVAGIFANVYLSKLDWAMLAEDEIIYARYSDDIVVFGTAEAVQNAVCRIKGYLSEMSLEVNPQKEYALVPHTKWEFLGFSYLDGVIDISEMAKQKLKAKIHRKARALRRWALAKDLPPEKAARALCKRMNYYLYCGNDASQRCWSRWYFPIINTAQSLQELDSYYRQELRYVFTGRHGKQNYNVRYETLKQLGYKPLKTEYLRQRKAKRAT